MRVVDKAESECHQSGSGRFKSDMTIHDTSWKGVGLIRDRDL